MEPRPLPPRPPAPPSPAFTGSLPNQEPQPPEHEFVLPSQVQLQRNIRTFQNDMAEHIQSTPMSVAHIAIAQHTKDNDDGSGSVVIANDSHPDKSILKKMILVLLSIMFIIAGVIGGYYFYTKSMLSRIGPVVVDTPEIKILTSQQTRTASWSQDLRPTLTALMSDTQGLTTQLGGVTEIVVTKNPTSIPLVPISSSEFLTTVGAKAPSTLIRALEPEFMIGIYRGPERDTPFIILKENNFQNSYAGLLLWESDMYEDLSWILQPLDSQSAAFSISNVLAFNDALIKNKDARILKTKQGNHLISYAFVDDKTIIITSDSVTLSALIDNIEKEAYIRKK